MTRDRKHDTATQDDVQPQNNRGNGLCINLKLSSRNIKKYFPTWDSQLGRFPSWELGNPKLGIICYTTDRELQIATQTILSVALSLNIILGRRIVFPVSYHSYPYRKFPSWEKISQVGNENSQLLDQKITSKRSIIENPKRWGPQHVQSPEGSVSRISISPITDEHFVF